MGNQVITDNIIIFRNGQPYGNNEIVTFTKDDNRIIISSDSKQLVDFYAAIIPRSSVAQDLKDGKPVLRRIVTSTYGGAVMSVEDESISQNDFDTEKEKLEYSKTITI